MKNTELKYFHNEGFGWVCKVCEQNLQTKSEERSRLLREGEAESKNPVFSNRAMAKWKNEKQNELICQQCGKSEKVGSRESGVKDFFEFKSCKK